jgi:hypothetical protein
VLIATEPLIDPSAVVVVPEAVTLPDEKLEFAVGVSGSTVQSDPALKKTLLSAMFGFGNPPSPGPLQLAAKTPLVPTNP